MRLLRSPARRDLLGLVLGALGLLGLALVAAPAGAQSHPTSSPTTSHTGGQPSLSQLAPGLEILDASVTGNGPESGRTLDSSQATAFVQAWLPESVFGTPPFEDPPSTLPVYEVDVGYKYLGTLGSMTINYRVERHLRVGVDAAPGPLARGGRHPAALDLGPRPDGGRVRGPLDASACPHRATHLAQSNRRNGVPGLVLDGTIAHLRGSTGPGRRDRNRGDPPTRRALHENPDNVRAGRRSLSGPSQ